MKLNHSFRVELPALWTSLKKSARFPSLSLSLGISDKRWLPPTPWYFLQGFSVDGKTGSDDEQRDSYENKCVRVDSMGESEDEALDGFVMRNMLVQNCGWEGAL